LHLDPKVQLHGHLRWKFKIGEQVVQRFLTWSVVVGEIADNLEPHVRAGIVAMEESWAGSQGYVPVFLKAFLMVSALKTRCLAS
jgi:hypothetical protein